MTDECTELAQESVHDPPAYIRTNYGDSRWTVWTALPRLMLGRNGWGLHADLNKGFLSNQRVHSQLTFYIITLNIGKTHVILG